MVLTKEYRICMPLTVEEYQIGQLYMIARHSHEQSEGGEGVEVVENTTCEDPEHGKGQYTEKRIHLSSRLPYWIQSFLPKLFYVTEKAWNYYPYTITEYTCSFVSKFCISIKTKYEDNNGCTENCLNLDPEVMSDRLVEYLDIAYDEVNPKHYKEEEDVRYFKSIKTGRGPLCEGWRDHTTPIMCSYKMVTVHFEIWGVQSRAEDMIQRTIKDILLLGHRQAFAWIDQWYGMSLSDVRAYEKQMQLETNTKVSSGFGINDDGDQPTKLPECIPVAEGGASSASQTPTTPNAPKTNKSWFSWS